MLLKSLFPQRAMVVFNPFRIISSDNLTPSLPIALKPYENGLPIYTPLVPNANALIRLDLS